MIIQQEDYWPFLDWQLFKLRWFLREKGEVSTGQAAGCLVKIKDEYYSNEFLRKIKQI